jgi:hypothetical protein
MNPITCKDGSLGFDKWNMLKAAVQEANSISAERFLKWSSYFANVGKQFVAFNEDLLYYPASTPRSYLLECGKCGR